MLTGPQWFVVGGVILILILLALILYFRLRPELTFDQLKGVFPDERVVRIFNLTGSPVFDRNIYLYDNTASVSYKTSQLHGGTETFGVEFRGKKGFLVALREGRIASFQRLGGPIIPYPAFPQEETDMVLKFCDRIRSQALAVK